MMSVVFACYCLYCCEMLSIDSTIYHGGNLLLLLFACISPRDCFGYPLEIKTLVQILVEEFSHARWQSWLVPVGDIPCAPLDRSHSYGRETY